MNIFKFDELLRKRGYIRIAGIDEAGRGPLAGPVVAAAVILKESVQIDRLRDSKKVSEKERESLFHQVVNSALDFGIGIVGPEEIDKLNILKATKIAMHLAIHNLSFSPDFLIIDAVSLASVPFKQLSLIKCENRSASVAAASIIAKYIRDSIMINYHRQYPKYNFKKHKGYSTQEHLDMLRLYGPCPIHRKTFHRVMSLKLSF